VLHHGPNEIALRPGEPYVIATLRGKRVAFLARHGAGHRLLPSELNFRANIYGFKTLGVEYILSASAVGSLKEEYRPMDLVIPDQFVDRTFVRQTNHVGHNGNTDDSVVGTPNYRRRCDAEWCVLRTGHFCISDCRAA